MVRLKKIRLDDGSTKIEIIKPTPEETEERKKLHEVRSILNKEYLRHLRKTSPEERYIERAIKRFWKFVDRKGETECWNWLGSVTKNGRGEFSYKGRNIGAHQMSCIIHNIEVPDGLEITHTCNNGSCVNPNHFKIDTHDNNMKYMALSGRSRVSKGEENPNSKMTEKDVKEIRKKYLSGNSIPELVKEYNTTWASVYFIVNNITWTDENYKVINQRQERANKIMEDYMKGETDYNRLSLKYGVSYHTVWRIVNNKTWKSNKEECL